MCCIQYAVKIYFIKAKPPAANRGLPLPCAHGAGVFQQEHCRVLLVRQPVVKGVQGGGHALCEVPFPLRSDTDAGEGAVRSLLVDAAFQRGEDGDAHGDQPAAQAPEGAVVLLLGITDFGGEFQQGGFVEARGCGPGGTVALGDLGLHVVEGLDVGELEPHGFRACVAHRQEGEAVTEDDVHG